ncbi:acyl-CoA dehydrogenase family protein [Streptomyces sp. NPDC058486]|uniref:acyl-CoA dehydrogenase family protein n=1 Tax=unclassified Streptomyces TaxID=2593676 RepID=UPI003650A3D8
MIILDERLRALRTVTAELAGQLRAHALAVDADPADLKPFLDLPAYDVIRQATTPVRLTGKPLRLGRFTYSSASCAERAVSTLELARGDAGMLLACPGPALAGLLLDELGDAAQQELFHSRLADGATWSFFAMTEPDRGNDAANLETRLVPDGSGLYRLHGTKRYIGNGSRGSVGVVFARTGRGPMAIRAALVEVPAPGYRAHSLDMVGLRGARLSEIGLDGVPVPADMLLGAHLSPARRGLWGALRAFNHMRVQVAAMAVGTGLALHELVGELRPSAPGTEEYAGRLEACRHLVYAAGTAVDLEPDGKGLPSTAKLTATRLAVEVGRWATRALGPAALVEHPLLEKWVRDVGGFEFMEGTTNIQRQHVARTHLKGGRAHGGPVDRGGLLRPRG